MNKLKLVSTFICLTLMLVLIPTVGIYAKQKQIRMRGASDHPPVAPHCVILKKFEKNILEETKGRVKFEWYPGGELYKQADALVALQRGTLQYAVGGNFLASVSQGWDLISGLPFLFDDDAHFERFLNTDGYKIINDNLEARGITHLCHFGQYGAAQIFNSKHSVEKLEDFKGLKIRFPPQPMFLEMAKALGITSISCSPSEVITALETGMVDGNLAHAFSMHSYGMEKSCPYMTKCNIIRTDVTMVVNKKWWNNLSPDIQQIILNVFEKGRQKIVNIVTAGSEKLYAGFAAVPGNVVTEITKTEKARWLEALKPLYDKARARSKECRMVIEAAESTRQ